MSTIIKIHTGGGNLCWNCTQGGVNPQFEVELLSVHGGGQTPARLIRGGLSLPPPAKLQQSISELTSIKINCKAIVTG